MGGLSERRNPNPTRTRERGAVYVEVLACLVPLLVLFFCGVQLAFFAAGGLAVTHAATRGARAAIVLLEDDPEKHGGAPRGDLNAAGGGQSSAFADTLARSVPSAVPLGKATGGARLQAIREAVYVPLAVLAPPPEVFLSGRASTLRQAVGGDERGGVLARFAVGILAYVRGASVVTVRAAPGSQEILTHVDPRADVTVHVTFLQHCAVPIAARLMCHPAWDLAGYGRVLPELQRLDPSQPVQAARVLRQLRDRFPAPGRFQELADELARAESPGVLLPLMLGGGRFHVLDAEATLPNQGAAYVAGSAVASR
jgi:hypothetical protein